MWPLAMLHGLTAGTDGTATWMLVIDAVCLVAVVAALSWRIYSGTPNRAILPEVVAASSWRLHGTRRGRERPGDRR